MKKGMRFLCKVVCFAVVLLCAGNLSAAQVEPASGTIYILLGTSRGGQNVTDWQGAGIKGFVQNNILGASGDTSLVNEYYYDLSSGTPAEFARNRLFRSSGTSILDSAQLKWFKNSKNSVVVSQRNHYKNLSALKSARPDSVPSRFVVIADGAAGLAVREYIQSSAYKGEIANVLFFNTPHEGTGLADQVVLSGTNGLDRDSDNSKYVALVPLALAAYIVGGVDGLQDLMISLLKDAVMAMAYSVGDVGDVLSGDSLLEGYSAGNASTWYLTQDASESDGKYKDALSNNTVGADSLLGSVQLLNSYSMNSGFNHPMYNVTACPAWVTVAAPSRISWNRQSRMCRQRNWRKCLRIRLAIRLESICRRHPMRFGLAWIQWRETFFRVRQPRRFHGSMANIRDKSARRSRLRKESTRFVT